MLRFLKKKNAEEQAKEKRAARRISSEEICVVEFETLKSQSKRLGEMKDISLSGIRFATIFQLKKKEALKITLFFPKKFYGTKTLCLDAVVARIYKPARADRYRVGCMFTDISPEDREAIRQFVFWNDTKTD